MTGLHRQPSERMKLRHIHSAVNHYAILFQSTHKGHCCDLHNIFHNNTTCRKEKGLLINSVIISWSPPLCVRPSKFLGDQTKSWCFFLKDENRKQTVCESDGNLPKGAKEQLWREPLERERPAHQRSLNRWVSVGWAAAERPLQKKGHG